MTLAERIEQVFEMVADALHFKIGDRVNMKNSNNPTKVYEVIEINAETGGMKVKDEVTGEIADLSEEAVLDLEVEKVRLVKRGIFS